MLNTDRVWEAVSGCAHTPVHRRTLSVKVSDVAHWLTARTHTYKHNTRAPVAEGTDMLEVLNIKGCNLNG